MNDEAICQEETKAEEEFVINQIYGLFEFNRTIRSITQFIERTAASQQIDQSQHGKQLQEQHLTVHSSETSLNSINLVNSLSKQPSKASMDKVNGIEMEFIFKKRGHSPETDRLRKERNRILKPDRLRIVRAGRENERLQEYRPSQQGCKQVEKLNTEI